MQIRIVRPITSEFIEPKVSYEPKYPWIRSRWILEQWFSPERVYDKNYPDTVNGSYECIYVFEDKNLNPLPLNIKVVQLIVWRMNQPASSPALIASRLKAEVDQKEKDDVLWMDRYFDTTSDIASNLHFGEGIIVPSNYGDWDK